MNDDEDHPYVESGREIRFTVRRGVHAAEFKLGPLWSTVGIVVVVCIAALTATAALRPWMLAIGALAILPPWNHVWIDSTGTHVRQWWGLIPSKARHQVLSCSIVVRYHADAGVHAEIGDIWLAMRQDTIVWLEHQRRRIAQEVPRGPYR